MVDIIDELKEGGFTTSSWLELGLRLRIKNDDLTIIETNYPKDVVRCLKECLVKWLKTGKATYTGLAELLKRWKRVQQQIISVQLRKRDQRRGDQC